MLGHQPVTFNQIQGHFDCDRSVELCLVPVIMPRLKISSQTFQCRPVLKTFLLLFSLLCLFVCCSVFCLFVAFVRLGLRVVFFSFLFGVFFVNHLRFSPPKSVCVRPKKVEATY